MLERIGENLPRMYIYSGLFPDNTDLHKALTNVYVDILKFCFGARKVL